MKTKCVSGSRTRVVRYPDGSKFLEKAERAEMKSDHPAIALVGRLLIVYIFLTSGIGKVFSWQDNVAYMNTRHLMFVPALLAAAAIVELGGSLYLITGFRARVAALVMAGYLAVVTLLFHNYWSFTENLAGQQETHFRKNLAIMGGLLILASPGNRKVGIGEEARIQRTRGFGGLGKERL